MNKGSVHEKGKFSFLDMIKNVKNEADFKKAGAIALFIGVVRGETVDGATVQKLELEAYEEKSNETLNSICNDLKKEKGIVDVQIHHLLGEFNAGEDIVYVMVAGEHRKNLFPVLEKAVERYKKEAPIFKKEYVVSRKGKPSAYWITEKSQE